MELVCVRHGRTSWNSVRRFQGRTDIPLDDEGRAQAQALAAHLTGERFAFALSSPLVRAWATAQAIVAQSGVTVEPEPRLQEMQFGTWEGLTWEEIVAQTPGLAYEYEKSPRAYVAEGGESFDDLCARVAPVLASVTERLAEDATALLVAHAGPMHALLRLSLGEDDATALGVKLVPAGIIRFVRVGTGAWTLASLNEIAPPLAESGTVAP